MTWTYPGIVYLGGRPCPHDGELPRNALALLVVAHVGLGLLLRLTPAVSALHALVILAVGLYFAVTRPASVFVACTAGYLCGAEVLWRMTQAPVPWEFSKFAMMLIFGTAYLLNRESKLSIPALVYAACLLPSCPLTLDWGYEITKAQWSFNLSGPMALAAAVAYFSSMRVSRGDLRAILLAVVLPVVAVAAIAAYGIATNPDNEFVDESNFATSGGFGPNQVSATLGLGGFCALLVVLQGVKPITSAAILLTVSVGLLGQSMLTFSRGGLYGAGVGTAAACVCLMAIPSVRSRILTALPIAVGAMALVVLPQLDRMTQGALSARFADTRPSHRDELMRIDLQVWQEHPVLGVGPGISRIYHRRAHLPGAAHTEYTRLLADHGIFGLIAMFVLFGSVVHRFLVSNSPLERALVAGLSVWALSFMATNGMRLAAPSFAFGLGFLNVWSSVAVVARNGVRQLPAFEVHRARA